MPQPRKNPRKRRKKFVERNFRRLKGDTENNCFQTLFAAALVFFLPFMFVPPSMLPFHHPNVSSSEPTFDAGLPLSRLNKNAVASILSLESSPFYVLAEMAQDAILESIRHTTTLFTCYYVTWNGH